jgi:hypothetical protein
MSTMKIKLPVTNNDKHKLEVVLHPVVKKQKVVGDDVEALEVPDDVALAEEAIADQLDVEDDDAGADELPCDVEADEDEDDPEMVECAECGIWTHVSVGKCSNEGCDYVFKFTTSGHLMDGFVVGEGSVEYVEGGDEEEEEEEYQDSDDDDSVGSTTGDEEEECPWVNGDSDGSWEP